MKEQIKFDRDTVLRILETASYQSSWLQILIPHESEGKIQPNSETSSEKWADIIVNGGSLIAEDFEDDSEYIFDIHSMEKGWKKFSKDYKEEAEDIINDCADYFDCDIYMQFVILGEYVYG